MDSTIIPSHAIRVGVKDSLKVTFWGKTSGSDLYLRAQVMHDDGNVVPITEFLPSPASLASTATKTVRLTDGWLTSVSCILDATDLPGMTWAVVELVREETASNQSSIALVSGAVSYYRSVSWPGVPPVSSLESMWQPGQLEVANPGASNPLTFTLDGYEMFHIKSMYFQFVTSATVADRYMKVKFDYGSSASEVMAMMATIAQPASQTYTYALNVGGNADVVVTVSGAETYLAGLADVPLPVSARIIIYPGGMQVGDTLSNINLLGLRKIWT